MSLVRFKYPGFDGQVLLTATRVNPSGVGPDKISHENSPFRLSSCSWAFTTKSDKMIGSVGRHCGWQRMRDALSLIVFGHICS